MAQINGHGLTRWDRGDRLAAEDLNGNFLTLYEMVIEALAQARVPDGAVVGLEMEQGRLRGRVEGLEKLTAMHAHQRNEKQYVPLSYLGAMVTQVNDLRRDVEDAIGRVNKMHAALGVNRDDLERRLLRIEQKPEAADKEAFTVVASDHERVAFELKAARAEIVKLRHEVKILRDWMQGARDA